MLLRMLIVIRAFVSAKMANMAEAEFGNSQILKNTKIIVNVEEALEDLLVVSFTCGTASFQGVLLNSTKKNWPCGVIPPATAFPGSGESQVVAEQATLDSDKLFAVSRRYTYFQESDNRSKYAIIPRRTNCRRLGDKSARTMRLRPRQVLCSKCKSICNENSENVEVANAAREASRALDKKADATTLQSASQSKNGAPAPNDSAGAAAPCSSAENNTQDGSGCDRMVLRRRRVAEEAPSDETRFPKEEEASHLKRQKDDEACGTKRSKEDETSGAKRQREVETCGAKRPRGEDEVSGAKRPKDEEAFIPKRPKEEETPGAKRSKEDESCGARHQKEDEPSIIKRLKECESENTCPTTIEIKPPLVKTSPFIKISFGPQGTVLKIPPRSNNYSASDTDAELQEAAVPSTDAIDIATKDAGAKAAKKALKKAKKEAQRKSTVVPFASSDPFQTHKTRHHKHKFKHKRRHKDGADNNNCDVVADFNGMPLDEENDDKPQDLENETLSLENWDCGSCDGSHHRSDAYNEIKKECLRQKLSISLKRLSEKSYMKCSSAAFNDDSNGSGGTSSHSDSNSNSEAGDVPEFPQSEPPKDFEKVRPLMMRISSHAVVSCNVGDGRNMAVGDIVWGKIHGFPWWPGKVLSIMVSQRDNGMLITQQAHVAWFGSSTSSYMPCSQLVPFLECFKIRYNKKKRGPYKEAIKQATLAAQQVLRGVAVKMET